jgi:hypothetical protein
MFVKYDPNAKPKATNWFLIHIWLLFNFYNLKYTMF